MKRYCVSGLEDGKRTIRIEASGIGVEDIRNLSRWMLDTARWIERQQDRDDGGYRWVFRRGAEPTACYMAGRRRTTKVIPLVPVKLRQRRRRGRPLPWTCHACESELGVGTQAWRQRSGAHAGYSHIRFCSDCVERGGPPPKPTLTIISGDAEAAIPTPRKALTLATPEPGGTHE